MRVRAKQLIGQLLVAESGAENDEWNADRYYWTSRSQLEKAAAALGLTTERVRHGFVPHPEHEDRTIHNFVGPIIIKRGKRLDQVKFDRALARLGAVAEACKKSAGWNCDCYYWTPRDKLEQAAKALGFTPERSYHCFPPTRATPEDLVINNFAGGVVVKQGKQMDQSKFDRELARLSAVAESATDYGFPKTGTWEVLPKTIRLYPNANALKVHAALKSMGITPIRPDPTKGTPRRIIELTYYSMGIPDDVVFDFARFARELARARSSSE